MWRLMLWFAACLAVLAGCVDIVRPSENGLQTRVYMGTPTYQYHANGSIEQVQWQMMAAVLPGQEVFLAANDPAECVSYADELETVYGVSPTVLAANFRCEVIEHTDIWFRDMGGIAVHGYRIAPGTHAEYGGERVDEGIAIVDYQFDGWGYGPYSSLEQLGYYEIDDGVATEIANALGYPVINSPLTTEGGAFQSNGAGTTAYSLPALQQRNPGWSQAAIEFELARTLGAEHLIALPEFHPFDGHAVLDGPLWLDGVPYQLPFTVRHADEFMQFVDAHTILVSQVEASEVTNLLEQSVKNMLDRTWDFLSDQVDQNGNPFTLVPFPDPGFIPFAMTDADDGWFFLGELNPQPDGYNPSGGWIVEPASYMNYVLTNDKVLVPSFYKLGRNPDLINRDAQAAAILASLYPGRTVEQIDAEDVNVGGGGMHCITQEERALP